VAPIQLAIGIGLLIGNVGMNPSITFHLLIMVIFQLGYSALVALGVLVLAFPLQVILVKIMFAQRKKAVKITDLRIRLTTEVLQGIRLIKLYAWEAFYTGQISDLRKNEIHAIRRQA
jgi:ATP-binding cassette subfamily C (CFTR/MRP) protein 1